MAEKVPCVQYGEHFDGPRSIIPNIPSTCRMIFRFRVTDCRKNMNELIELVCYEMGLNLNKLYESV